MYRKALILVILVFSVISVMNAQNVKTVTDIILSGYSAKSFTSDPISDQDLETVLRCGIKAPSGMNRQPWKFIVIRETKTVTSIIKNATPGNILIIVAGVEPSQPGRTPDFDCALAMENMYIAAQALGLGSHIYVSSIGDINSTRRQELGIPDGYIAVAILRIGHVDRNVDATSSASPRNKFEDVVVYK
jgi:nitroreductase